MPAADVNRYVACKYYELLRSKDRESELEYQLLRPDYGTEAIAAPLSEARRLLSDGAVILPRARTFHRSPHGLLGLSADDDD